MRTSDLVASTLPKLLRVAELIEDAVVLVGRIASWLVLILIGIIVTDVVFRRFSTTFQEIEWHLHGALFLLTLGYGYLRGAHVRIELIHERLTPRTKAWIEFWGLALALIPYCAAIVWFGFEYVERAYVNAEASPSPGGLPHRWVIKSVLLVGFAILALAGIGRLIKAAVYLFGPGELAGRTGFACAEAVAEAKGELKV